MAVTPSIRDAVADDLPSLMELFHQLSQDGGRPESHAFTAGEAQHDALRRLTTDPDARVVVLEAEGHVVATLTLYVLTNLTHGAKPAAIVENVVVDEAARGGGYGRMLMAFAVEAARTAGCYRVSLTSNNKRSPAHAFYEAIGFGQTHKGFSLYLVED